MARGNENELVRLGAFSEPGEKIGRFPQARVWGQELEFCPLTTGCAQTATRMTSVRLRAWSVGGQGWENKKHLTGRRAQGWRGQGTLTAWAELGPGPWPRNLTLLPQFPLHKLEK